MNRDLRNRILKKARRMRESRSRGNRLWTGLGLVGSVGWMVALPMVGGALAGRWLDARYDMGLQFTLGLLLLGLVVGGYSVWRFFLRDLT